MANSTVLITILCGKPMFDELRYRWALRKYMKWHLALIKSRGEMPPDPEEWGDEPHAKHAMGREVLYSTQAIGDFRSRYLVVQAHKYHVPIPYDEESWIQPRGAPEPFLSPEAAHKLNAEIRAVQKADWEFWQSRVTFALALIGSIFGILAYFKK